MAALFGAGHPVTAVGDPDQNIYAWRGASLYNLFRFPEDFPRADGTPAARLPLYTNFRSGARILAAADTVIGPVPEAQRPPGKRLVPVGGQRAGRGADRAGARRMDGGGRDRRPVRRSCTRRARSGPRWRCCVARRGCSGCSGRRSTSASVPVEIVGLAGLLQACPRWSRCSRTRARCTTRRRAWRSRGSCSGPATASGSRTSRCSPGWPSVETEQPARGLRAWRTTTSRAEPVLLAEALEHLEDGRGAVRGGTRAARRVPRGAPRACASRRGARSASSSAR